MRTLIVAQYFHPEVGGTQNRLLDLAKGLSDAGHEVTVLTAVPNHPFGTVPQEYRHRLVTRERLHGFDVVRVWIWTSPAKSFLNRMACYLSFMLLAIIMGIFYSRKADVVIGSSPSIFAGLAGYILSRIKGAKFILEVRDLWPAAAVELGELRSPILIRASERLEKFLYRKSWKISAMTLGFREHIAALGIPRENVVYVPYGATDAILNSQDERGLKPATTSNKFVVIYAGNHGIAQNLRCVLEAAALLAQDPNIVFRFVGDGPVKNDLVQLQRSLGLRNVIFRPQVPVARFAALLQESDVSLVSLDPHPIFGVHVPSKLFDSMACGVPVILSANGEAKSILEDANGGICVEPGNSAALAETIRQLRDMPAAKRLELGRNGRAYIVRHYTSRLQCLRLLQALNDDVGDSLGSLAVPVESSYRAHLLVPGSIVQED
jgi:glycosyltransferase involved in cell wall biosynthesis